jgi:hypothetical protein
MIHKYLCPICTQEFGRRWNLIRHINAMHQIDPFNKDLEIKRGSPQVGSTIERRLTNELSSHAQVSISNTIEELATRIKEAAKLRALALGLPIQNHVALSEAGINDLLNNYVLIPKSEVHGISGYFCESCLTFQLSHISKAGADLTSFEKHTCVPAQRSQEQTLQDRTTQREILYRESVDSLLCYIKHLVHPRSYVTVLKLPPNTVQQDSVSGQYRLVNFHAPLVVIHTNSPDYAWLTWIIRQNHLPVGQEILAPFVKKYLGTYVVVSIVNGILVGNFLISLLPV